MIIIEHTTFVFTNMIFLFKSLCFFAVTTLLCLSDETPGKNRNTDATDLSQANRAFSIKLLQNMYKNVSLVFSPTNIAHCLSALMTGLGGDTFDEVFNGLQYNLIPKLAKGKSQNQEQLGRSFLNMLQSLQASGNVSLSSGLYTDKKFNLREKFVKDVSSFYLSTAKSLDFLTTPDVARKTINDDISRATKGLITDLLAPGSIKVDTKMVLTSTIQFEDRWKQSFDSQLSARQTFRRDDGQTLLLKSMRGQLRLPYFEEPMQGVANENLKVLQLPYLSARFALYVILPPARTLPTLIKSLTVAQIERYIKSVNASNIFIVLPIFQTLSDLNLNAALENIGVQKIFRADGDFTGITKDKDSKSDLRVSTLIHKAILKVNENGTVAAAATAVGVSSLVTSFDFVALRPFMYLLYDQETQQILFIGAYTGH